MGTLDPRHPFHKLFFCARNPDFVKRILPLVDFSSINSHNFFWRLVFVFVPCEERFSTHANATKIDNPQFVQRKRFRMSYEDDASRHLLKFAHTFFVTTF